MSGSLTRAEALLNNFELKVAADYGPTRGREPSGVGQEIPDAPESVEGPIVEAGELFEEGLGHATPFADDEDLDEAEDYFEQAFSKYEEAVDNHLDYSSLQSLVDVDVVIDQALNGEIDEQSVIEAAGLPGSVMDDLESDQRNVRRNMDDEDAYQFLEESDYETESVVRDNYLQDLHDAQTEVENGIAEIR